MQQSKYDTSKVDVWEWINQSFSSVFSFLSIRLRTYHFYLFVYIKYQFEWFDVEKGRTSKAINKAINRWSYQWSNQVAGGYYFRIIQSRQDWFYCLLWWYYHQSNLSIHACLSETPRLGSPWFLDRLNCRSIMFLLQNCIITRKDVECSTSYAFLFLCFFSFSLLQKTKQQKTSNPNKKSWTEQKKMEEVIWTF